MSTYYEYREVKVMIAHRLMAMEGWKVYGYRADESDSMTDYYSPANWGGIAEKNGYILVVNNNSKKEAEEIRKYHRSTQIIDNNTKEKIQKLEAVTVERGATEHEEKTAKEKIDLLKSKSLENRSEKPLYEVIGIIPGHEANPPRCNWHIEKDGVILLKGSGLLKFSHIDENLKNEDRYNVNIEDLTNQYIESGFYSDREKAMKAALNHKRDMDEKRELAKQFDALIQKFDTTCGGMLGEGELITYDKIKVTEYKAENKAIESEGSLKDGQHFIVKTNGFSGGVRKGFVYKLQIHNGTDNKPYFTANRLYGKLKKELTGRANSANSWGYITSKAEDNFQKWIEKGLLAYCDIQEVKTPYEVEKVVKKVNKSDQTMKKKTMDKKEKLNEKDIDNNLIENLHYEIKEDIDTRDSSKIYLVKIKDKLDFDDYIKLNNHMKELGGYYSKFKRAFLFKTDPSKLLTA